MLIRAMSVIGVTAALAAPLVVPGPATARVPCGSRVHNLTTSDSRIYLADPDGTGINWQAIDGRGSATVSLQKGVTWTTGIVVGGSFTSGVSFGVNATVTAKLDVNVSRAVTQVKTSAFTIKGRKGFRTYARLYIGGIQAKYKLANYDRTCRIISWERNSSGGKRHTSYYPLAGEIPMWNQARIRKS